MSAVPGAGLRHPVSLPRRQKTGAHKLESDTSAFSSWLGPHQLCGLGTSLRGKAAACPVFCDFLSLGKA